MAGMNDELKLSLEILKIKKELTTVTKKDIYSAFKVLEKVLHPDKSGIKTTTSKFQDVRSAYDKLMLYVETNKCDDSTEVDESEAFFHENFKKFNFPCENKGSLTVNIEDHLANNWQSCLTASYGEPEVKIIMLSG